MMDLVRRVYFGERGWCELRFTRNPVTLYLESRHHGQFYVGELETVRELIMALQTVEAVMTKSKTGAIMSDIPVCGWCGRLLDYKGKKPEGAETCEQAYGSVCDAALEYLHEISYDPREHPDYIDESEEQS